MWLAFHDIWGRVLYDIPWNKRLTFESCPSKLAVLPAFSIFAPTSCTATEDTRSVLALFHRTRRAASLRRNMTTEVAFETTVNARRLPKTLKLCQIFRWTVAKLMNESRWFLNEGTPARSYFVAWRLRQRSSKILVLPNPGTATFSVVFRHI